MWNAMSNCYEKMGRRAEAVRCSERSERFKDKEGISLFKLAQLYEAMGKTTKAADCFMKILKKKGISLYPEKQGQ
jgi:anaphase-promoting complex subunit 8